MGSAILAKQTNFGSKSSTAGTTFTISASAVGFILVSVGVASATVTVTNVQDTGGNSYNRIGSKTNGTLIEELWSSTAVNAASPGTITVTLSATGTEAAGVVVVYTGVTSVGTGTAINGAGSPVDSGLISLAQRDNSCLAFGFAVAGVPTLTVTNGMLLVNTNSPDNLVTTGKMQDFTVGGGSTSTRCSATYSSGAWAAVYVELKGALPGQGGGNLLWGYDATLDSFATGSTISVQAGASDTVPAGSLIVAIWRTTQKGTGGQATISDNFNSGNYALAVLSDEAGALTGELACYYMQSSVAIAAGQLIVTASTPVSNGLLYLGILVYKNAGALDVVNKFSYGNTATSSPNSGNVTPSVAGDIAIGALALASSSSGSSGLQTVTTESSGFTSELDDHMGTAQSTPTYAHCHGADLIAGIASIAYNPTISASVGGCNVLIALFLPLNTGDTVALTGQYQLK